MNEMKDRNTENRINERDVKTFKRVKFQAILFKLFLLKQTGQKL